MTPVQKDRYYSVFEKFLPEGSADYCYSLWKKHQFEFKIKKSRKTKLGDYRYDSKTGKHIISVNNDLNPYSFLITYLHEIAHLLAFRKYGRSIQPHGSEWKNEFKKLTFPVLRPEIFPDNVIRAFSAYMINPKASSCSDPRLLKALKVYDQEPGLFLSELTKGEVFDFQGTVFQLMEKKRTRYVCLEKKSNKKYLISGSATVIKIES
ncbi:MAG: SprT-like domain-containing protein [Cyclobacteriaceae bacterium]